MLVILSACLPRPEPPPRSIWLAPWSPVKIIYLLNRYLMILESIIVLAGFGLHWSQDRCKLFIWWQTILPVVAAVAGGLLLLLRTHAIVSGNTNN